ncbi:MULTISPECIES: hypothetical protein [Amycolatopsis]|uniref:Secreted protein n=1 Tax=Amycolatopsis thermalba TaxID=944492 RepID=A0ABY4P4K3_9PSEU|nr:MULTISPECIES: hypothetical protein [Amycolatopsis]OXM73349.1 hypothetical protein CF166_10445 [Amycolatopsis sp. KNN50.9b]UQS27327.1 hypothetical protein L1857_33300 [Amycolatopsis thermalba]
MASAVAVTSLGVLLGTAGTAAAQDPWGKYPTKAKCAAVGKKHAERGYECVHHPKSPANERWWLYVI